ncbi:uncharacterized protein LOC120536370 [Polypterus senegalus]|uniref:uncharacterized protein LOC120536370 n=1 Tax=Polypterus senegalus TaxID=55291 RepID=UPI001962D065|nr:uncharacterized protein LOC120536370 [Polypterus senegalus]
MWIVCEALLAFGMLLISAEAQHLVHLTVEKQQSDKGTDLIFLCLLPSKERFGLDARGTFELYKNGELLDTKSMVGLPATKFTISNVSKNNDGSYWCVFTLSTPYIVKSASLILRNNEVVSSTETQNTETGKCTDYFHLFRDHVPSAYLASNARSGFVTMGIFIFLILMAGGIAYFIKRKRDSANIRLGAEPQIQTSASSMEADVSPMYSELQYTPQDVSKSPKEHRSSVVYSQIAQRTWSHYQHEEVTGH